MQQLGQGERRAVEARHELAAAIDLRRIGSVGSSLPRVVSDGKEAVNRMTVHARAKGRAVWAAAAAAALLAAAVLAAAGSASGNSSSVTSSVTDSCVRSRDLKVGPTAGPFFSTVSPFEHFASDRRQVFPFTCTLREIAGPGPIRIAAREAPGNYATPYIPVTRGRNQFYVYGYGQNPQTEGGFVARVDPVTLAQRWRTRIKVPPPGGWSYPGVLVAHGNGFLYAIYGNVLVKLDPVSGRTLARRVLPENPSGTGAAYNGMIVLPDGRIVAKGIERGPCNKPGTFGGLLCSSENQLPTPVVVVDPARLRILSHITPAQPITGRITSGQLGRTVYVYFAQHSTLVRYRYSHKGGTLQLDKSWGPVTYRTGKQTSGTGPGLLGHWLVVQTNFLPSPSPMTVTAVSLTNSKRKFQIRPFAAATLKTGHSFEVSKAALDTATGSVYTEDSAVDQLVGLRFSPRHGFSVKWRDKIESLEFVALVGPAAHRQLVFTDFDKSGDHVVWIDAATGRILARSGVLAHTPAPGNIVMPGFDGRFYYLGDQGQLWAVHPVHASR